MDLGEHYSRLVHFYLHHPNVRLHPDQILLEFFDESWGWSLYPTPEISNNHLRSQHSHRCFDIITARYHCVRLTDASEEKTVGMCDIFTRRHVSISLDGFLQSITDPFSTRVCVATIARAYYFSITNIDDVTCTFPFSPCAPFLFLPFTPLLYFLMSHLFPQGVPRALALLPS